MNLKLNKRLLPLIFVLFILFFLSSCSNNYQWGWYIISPTNKIGISNIEFLLGGLKFTIMVSLISMVFAIILGLIVSLASTTKIKVLNIINIGYTEIIRAIPVLVMILWVYYGLPVLFNLNFSAFVAGIIALSICESPFVSEIFRSGIQAVPLGQKEAGTSLGLNFFQKFFLITLPQAIRIILPALGNQFVYMLKMSSLVSIIGLNELTRKANELVVSQYRPLEIYTFLVLEYLVLILIVSYLVRRLENKLKIK
jgi:polar amino acid transport system permease protein|tara:strand:+ start:52 stop:813 length:762 start_codon:yes stop_codon:yes gene_type:complete